MRRFLAFAVFAAFLLGCSKASPTSEASKIYWAQGPRGAAAEHGTIARARLDGSGTDERFVKGTTGGAGVAVDGDHIYWTNYGGGTIGRARLDGTHVDQHFITGARFPIGLAVDGRHLDWTTYDGIARANLDGSEIDDDFISADAPVGLAVDREHIYWASKTGDHIGRSKLDGSAIDESFITGANRPVGVAVDGRHVYWSNGGDDTIGRANIDGSAVIHRCVAIRNVPIGNVPEGLAVDGRYVYWTNYPANTIGRANPDGTGVDAHFITVKGVPEGVAVSPNHRTRPQPDARARCVRSQARILLGSRRFQQSRYAAGWGEVAPAIISNGGAAASGTISSIRWQSWGGNVAVGRGLNPIYTPHGGYYRRPVVIQLRASAPRRCTPRGPLVYTRLTFREPSRPGGPVGRWYAWASNMCGDETISRKCVARPFNRGSGAHDLMVVFVKALPGGTMLSSRCENIVTATTGLGFAVTVEDTGGSQEVHLKVTLTIQQAPSPIVQNKTIDLINPGKQRTIIFHSLGQVQFATRTTVKVDVAPVPGEKNTANNSAQYPVIFSLG